MSTYVSLQEWAEKKFGHVPSSATLSNYAKNGQICPRPVKFGGRWRVDPDANFLELRPINYQTSNPLVNKILNSG
ncbi:excisionase [Vibrio metschnikovii]|uniref:excisionase n=1 Tax=Vibrio metschnikovii TaxID=28172 RepID=UPI001C2F266D|nr:excisionase [Vibrio metschnikovii]